ncbi:hypothetical protein [Mycobacterium camsae]|uniref:hypothetical protein n=1 Tax=Mycobacterium gordonae TaxID=1778 RepID=UPI0019808633|nr:hypothetical protein [Mycobacterium gordonae]
MTYFFDENPHIDGALELQIDNIAVLDRSMWDHIDQLWAYLVYMISDLKKVGKAHTYYPDQPLKLTFEAIGEGLVRVASYPSDGPRLAVVKQVELIRCLKASGIKFFATMIRINPKDKDMYYQLIEQLDAVIE